MADDDSRGQASRGVDASTQYIRTYAGDRAALEAGKTPDLAPLKTSTSPAAQPGPSPSAAPPDVPTSPPVPPRPSPGPLSVPAFRETPAGSAARPAPALEAAPLLPPAPPAPPSVSPPPPPVRAPSPGFSAEAPLAPEEPPTPVHTYAEDFNDRLRFTHASTMTVLAAEQDAARAPAAAAATGGNAVYVAAGALLLLFGAGSVYYAYARYVAKTAPVVLAPVVTAPIFVDDREEVSGTSTPLLLAIEQSVTRPLTSGGVRLLYTAVSTTTDNSVFAALQLPAPGILLRNVNAAGSMAGVVNVAGAQSPFFILSVASYGDTFAGMLSWEPTMPRDLAAFFPPYPASSATSTATTTEAVASSTPASLALPARTMRLGDRNADVTKLQKLLAQDASVYPEGLVTGAYGALTQKAVQRFQKKYGVVSSGTPATTGYGAVGMKTLAKLTEVFGASAPPAPAAPVFAPGFRDEVVANHDTRAYQDENGKTLLLYGYWDAQTLIIARDEAAFAALVSRLATSRT